MKTRLLTTLIAALLALSAWANGTEINGIYYELDSSTKTASVTYTGTHYNLYYNPSSTAYTGSITIPASVTYDGTTYSVTSIGENAFRSCSGLTSIIIPNSVTSIGRYAFRGCTGLTSIDIPNSVTTIGEDAFYECTGLTSITIPNSVTSIGRYAFADCTGLTSVTINSNNIVSKAYTYNSNLSNIFGSQVTTYILGDNVTSIGDYAFYDCTSLTSITIPSSVTSIGGSAFAYCTGLTSVTIPNSVTSIGEDAFKGCTGLTSITIPNSVTSIGNYAFWGCTGLTSITIPNSVTSIGGGAFFGCTGLTSITIPNSVTSIGSSAFHDCTHLTSINIPNSVTDIGSEAFSGCTGLTSITIPNSVTSIGLNAFWGCTVLKSIKVETGNTKYDSRENCNAIIETASNTLVAGCMVSTIPNSVTSIGECAFSARTHLTSINIPNSVTSIGSRAFSGCTGLTSINIPNSVTSIGEGAFSGCTCTLILPYPFTLSSDAQSGFKGSIVYSAKKGSSMVLQLWEKGYRVYDSTTEQEIPKPKFTENVTSTQSTVTFYIQDKAVEYEYSIDERSKAFTNSNEYTLTGLKPETGGEVYLYARVKGSNGSWIKLARSSYSTSRIFPYSSSLVSKKTPSTLVINPSLIKGDAVVTYRKLTIGSQEIDITKGKTTITGLRPDYEYRLNYTIKANGYDMETTYTVKTPKLTMTTQQAKVISAGNVIVAAETNLDDAETGVGFEWRRTDWTSDMASNSSATVLYEGAMEGYIRNLYTGAFWKYRPYYQASDGTRYYGEWVSFDPTNTSYFEPTVHTYATIDVKNNTASVKGYAMRGTDNVAQQGFKYWKVSSNTRAFNPASNRLSSVDIPSNAKTIQATGQVMTATLTNLEYASDYACVAFVTTTEGETFYGELQTFRTGADVTGIGDVVINAEEQTDSAPTIVGYYTLQGQRIAEPQRGQLVIVRYSDGTSRKMYVR